MPFENKSHAELLLLSKAQISICTIICIITNITGSLRKGVLKQQQKDFAESERAALPGVLHLPGLLTTVAPLASVESSRN